jgi:hypothetical protein
MGGIGAFLGIADKVLDVVFPDPTERAAAQAKIIEAHSKGQVDLASFTRDIIVAEAKGESWLQRNWRPLVMIWFAGLVGAYWMGYTAPNLPESAIIGLLDIVQIGIGGYIVGRSTEKVVRSLGENGIINAFIKSDKS